MLFQALSQFEIYPITLTCFSNSYIFSNMFIYLSTLLVVIIFLIYNSYYSNFLNNNVFLHILETLYIFWVDAIVKQVGKKGLDFFCFIFTLFIFLSISNLIGLMPFSFTITSHIIVTFSFGFTILLSITILGFIHQKLEFLNLFIPKGIPIWLLPLLVSIEVISFLSRGLSLSIRLFANIMSGHVLLHILTSFIFLLYNISIIAMVSTILIVLAVSSLELFLAVLQAYVFTILTCIYLSDSLNSPDH